MHFTKSAAALVAAGVLGIGTATSAMSEEIQMYGVIDYGINYQYVDPDTHNADSKSTFSMDSGMNSGSRIGIKGSEDLGNNTKIGFVLENGFTGDDGKMDNDDRLFGREAQIYVTNPTYGTVSFGRVGQLASANGTFGLLNEVSPFNDGWGDTIGVRNVTANGWGRMDNTITYVSPDLAGAKVHFQYSFKNDDNENGVEGRSSADRYYGAGVTYDAANWHVVGIVDSTNYSSLASAQNPGNDQVTMSLGGNYDLGYMKLHAFGQYFMNAKYVGNTAIQSNDEIKYGYSFAGSNYGGADGFGISLGTNVPLYGGNAKMSIGYMNAEADEDDDKEVSRLNIAVGYDYNLSKRTTVYTAMAYNWDSVSKEYRGVGKDTDPMSYEVLAGVVHRF